MVALNPFTSYLLGVISTVAGSWIASKIHIYHDARSAHREEIKKQILQPISDALSQIYLPQARRKSAIAQLAFGVTATDHSVRAEAAPVTQGNYVKTRDPRIVEQGFSEALLDDASEHHHVELMDGWNEFRESWLAFSKDLEEWIGEIRVSIAEATGFPEIPTEVNGPYATTERLAVLVYERLFEIGERSLRTDHVYATDRYTVFDGGAYVATGVKQQVQLVVDTVNSLIERNRHLAAELRARLAIIERQIVTLSEQVSFALAAKHLKGRCNLVPFF